AEPTAEPAEETAEAAGQSSEASEQAAGASGTNADEQPGSGTDAEYTEPAPLTDLETPMPVDDPLYEAAQSCVGRSVEELYEAVGEPTGGSQYAASCLEENAEDGMLYYDGFYVWTVKNDSGETVHAVYLSQ
ncbi:MAG: hypothetical protein IKD79_06550, partial [Oscillospiraceae bacterium]|nr:hypothetical protein [Oscillospiraceae bacterium]